MTPEQIDLVHESAGRIAPQLRALSTTFFERLFAAHPEVRPMFASNMDDQEEKFAESIAAIVEVIPDAESFTRRARDLGRLHVVHGVVPEQYGPVGAVLLEVLAEYDAEWSESTADAWGAAYSALSDTMIESSQH